jgi:shikimate kinase
MKKNNIILVGFMGVGKGTVSRALCKATKRFGIDTDDLIESLENRAIKKIFKEEGEPYFRELEKRCALWIEDNVFNTIISTGGGFYKQENIKQLGTIIYLQSSFEGIITRIKNSPNAEKKFKKRPLLNDFEKAKELFNSRIKDYQAISDIVIDVENKHIDNIIEEILEQI